MHEGKFLIGHVTAKKLNLLKIGYDVNHFQDDMSTKTIGKIKVIKVVIPLRDDIISLIQPFRRIAEPLEKEVNAKIAELLVNDIAEEVEKPSKRVSPVVAEKRRPHMRKHASCE